MDASNKDAVGEEENKNESIPAIAGFIAKYFGIIASALGGPDILEESIKEIGILEEDLLVVVQEEGKEAANEDNDNNAVAFAVGDNTRRDAKKRRAVYQRQKKEDSFWWT